MLDQLRPDPAHPLRSELHNLLSVTSDGNTHCSKWAMGLCELAQALNISGSQWLSVVKIVTPNHEALKANRFTRAGIMIFVDRSVTSQGFILFSHSHNCAVADSPVVGSCITLSHAMHYENFSLHALEPCGLAFPFVKHLWQP